VDFTQFAIGNLVGIAGFVLIVAGVMKAFQMATALNEIKELLADIKRNTTDRAPGYVANPAVTTPPPPPFYSQSGDEMLRALTAEEPAAQPEIVQHS
jgi:hypothetical protein